MIKAWFALAALAGIAVAGVIVDLLPRPSFDAPVYLIVDAPATAEICAQWHARAIRRARHWRASLEAYEGFSRYQGACHPKDQSVGRAMIESAMTKGAGETLFIEYVLALSMHGEGARAVREFPISAAIVMDYFAAHKKVPPDWEPLLPAVVQERARFRSLDKWTPIIERIDHVLSRPTIAAQAERAYLNLLLFQLLKIDEFPGNLMMDKVGRLGRVDLPKGRHRDMYLEAAADCGHAEAIRLRAQLYLSDQLTQPDPVTIAWSLAWLDDQEGIQSDFLAMVFAKGRFHFSENDQRRAIESYEHVKSRNCGTRTK
jgi:hypothetical protein